MEVKVIKRKLLIVKRHEAYNPYLIFFKEIFERNNFIVEITDPNPPEKLLDKIKTFKPNYLFCISLFQYLSSIGKLVHIPVILETQRNSSKSNQFVIPEIIYKFDTNIENLISAFNITKETFINALSKESASHHRSYFLRNIPDLTVYGNNDWKELNWKNIIYKGSINQFNDVSEVFFKTKINVNITRIYALDGLSDRIFNILYSGGFLFSNRSEPLLELFDDKKEVVSFNSVDELKSLLNYYLKNENERKKIALAGYQKVIKEHSFSNRVDFILKNIK